MNDKYLWMLLAGGENINPLALALLESEKGEKTTDDLIMKLAFAPVGKKILERLTRKIYRLDPVKRSKIIASLVAEIIGAKTSGTLGKLFEAAGMSGLQETLSLSSGKSVASLTLSYPEAPKRNVEIGITVEKEKSVMEELEEKVPEKKEKKKVKVPIAEEEALVL